MVHTTKCLFVFETCNLVQFIGTQPGNCSCSVEKENKAKRLAVVKANLHKFTRRICHSCPRKHAVQTLKMKIEPAHVSNFVAHLVKTGVCQFHFTHMHCTALILYNEECLIYIMLLSAFFFVHIDTHDMSYYHATSM